MYRLLYYMLTDDRQIVATEDAVVWGEWFHTADRRVAWDQDESGWYVSTVFLGLDHNFGSKGPPVLFETMVFAPTGRRQRKAFREAFVDQWNTSMVRSATWEEAVSCHRVMYAALRVAIAGEARARERRLSSRVRRWLRKVVAA
jgi:hypothetical protein